MATIALRQPVEVILHQGTTHLVNGGFCLQCNETETYLTENGGSLLATIRPAYDGVALVDLDLHN